MYVVDRGLTSQPLCLFNGLLIAGKSARDSFFEGMQKEQPYTRELIKCVVATGPFSVAI
jgi:hypothetical protein